MIRTCRWLCLAVAFVCFGTASLRADDPAAGKQVAQSTKVKNEKGEEREIKYWLFLPKADSKTANADKKFPTILFLHGAGERGDNLDAVKKHGPPKNIAKNDDFGFITISPQCPTGKWWNSTELTQLIDHVEKTQAVDSKRLYLTGLSMGGFGTWSLASTTPDRFAAIVPICGGGNVNIAEKIKGIPTWVFHGAKDTAVNIKQSEDLVAALKKAGGEPKFTIYPDAGHDSWTVSYENQDLYKWLLEQKKGEAAKAAEPAKPAAEAKAK